MRKALVVGINYYEHGNSLYGCVNDANAVKAVLERNSDGTVNFGVKLLVDNGPNSGIRRGELREQIQELFDGDSEVALFYFSGHGHLEITGGYLIASDSESGDDGVPLSDIMVYANKSRVKNKIIVLDCCHSGIAGVRPSTASVAEITEGMTILTASTAEQYASEVNGHGVFTDLLVDALSGAAGNLVGDVTPGSVYAHIDQSLGPWNQRPVFKTNVKSFVSLRKVQAPISLTDLRRLTDLFPSPGYLFGLDPTFEPERSSDQSDLPLPDPKHTDIFAVLQRYSRVNLVVPVGAPHMWHAAMSSKPCRLTALGEHYRRLVERDLI